MNLDPDHTQAPRASDADGPFDLLLVAGETRVAAGARWHVLRPEGMRGWIIQLTTAGRGLVRLGGSEHAVERGDVLLFAPAAGHDYDRHPAAAGWVQRWAYFRPRPHWLPWLAWAPLGPHCGRLRLEPEPARALARALAGVAAAVRAPGALAQERAHALLELALLGLAELRAGAAAGGDPRLQRARAFIDEHHHRPLAVAEVARHAGLSPSRLAHLFRAHFGMGVIAWRDAQRMARAAQLLRTTGLPVAAVARQVGYGDPLFFARSFRRRQGASPSAFRAARSHLPDNGER